MKTLVLFVVLTVCVHVNAQVFSYIAGDATIHAAAGIQSVNWDESDTAGYKAKRNLSGVIYRLNFDYAISRFMGLGLGYAFTKVLSQTRGQASESRISEFAPELTVHIPLNSHLLSFCSVWGIGYLHYRYYGDDSLNSGAYANAFSFFGELRPRMYLSRQQKLGFFAWYRLAYDAGQGASGNSAVHWYEYDISGYSQSAGLGIFYRLGKKRMRMHTDAETNTDQ